MNKQELNRVTKARMESALDTIFWTLNSLEDYWDEDVQVVFEQFLDEEGVTAWGIPSIEEARAQFGAFWRFLRENTKGA